MNCKKCDYEWCSVYLDDDGNEFVPSHYCNNNKFYDCDTEEWENDNLREEKWLRKINGLMVYINLKTKNKL